LALPPIEVDPTFNDSKQEILNYPESPQVGIKPDNVFLTNGISSPGNNEVVIKDSPRDA